MGQWSRYDEVLGRARFGGVGRREAWGGLRGGANGAAHRTCDREGLGLGSGTVLVVLGSQSFPT